MLASESKQTINNLTIEAPFIAHALPMLASVSGSDNEGLHVKG